MKSPRFLFCLAPFALATILPAQTPPSAYTITQTVAIPPIGSTQTISRSGTKAFTDTFRPAQGAAAATHTYTLYDIATGITWSWDPATQPITCSAGHFSGDWGDPFAMTADLQQGITKGDFKPAGKETIGGIPTTIYTGVSSGTSIKAWLDEKDGLVMRAMIDAPGSDLQPLVDIKKVAFATPAPSLFALPAACVSVKPPPTPAELISDATGDDPADFVNAVYGPGSKDTCTIALHVVQAKTMAPITRKFQIAIDTTHLVGDPNPPAYTFGVGTDGTSTYSGGGIHEVTNQVHDGVLRIVNPPASFELALNVITPGQGTGSGGVYRQCFGPVTNLYYVMKDQSDPFKGGDYLYAKSGKYAAAPAH